MAAHISLVFGKSNIHRSAWAGPMDFYTVMGFEEIMGENGRGAKKSHFKPWG